MTKCFFLDTTEDHYRYLRRYASSDGKGGHYHNAKNLIETVRGKTLCADPSNHPEYHKYLEDPKWPKACECGYEFKDDDKWQIFHSKVFKRRDDGSLLTLEDAPAGAMYYNDWKYHREGPDGHTLYVKTPGGWWNVDSRASNCTLPDDKEHYCWVREGAVPNVNVTKNGNTCSAGAGSIMVGDYHGFLRDGSLA